MSDTARRTAHLSHRRIQEIATGFQLLIGRNLPDATRRTRVVHQYHTLIKPAADALDEGLRPLQERERDVALLDDEQEQARELAALASESARFWASTLEVSLPAVVLCEEDLPRPLKGKMRVGTGVVDGADNASDNARIQALLAPEFFDLRDPDAGAEGDAE